MVKNFNGLFGWCENGSCVVESHQFMFGFTYLRITCVNEVRKGCAFSAPNSHLKGCEREPHVCEKEKSKRRCTVIHVNNAPAPFFDLSELCGVHNQDLKRSDSLKVQTRPEGQFSTVDSSRILRYLQTSPNIKTYHSGL